MSGSSSETKSEDVEMADAAQPAAEEAPKKKAAAAGKAPRFEIKKWNAVVSISNAACCFMIMNYVCCWDDYLRIELLRGDVLILYSGKVQVVHHHR